MREKIDDLTIQERIEQFRVHLDNAIEGIGEALDYKNAKGAQDKLGTLHARFFTLFPPDSEEVAVVQAERRETFAAERTRKEAKP